VIRLARLNEFAKCAFLLRESKYRRHSSKLEAVVADVAVGLIHLLRDIPAHRPKIRGCRFVVKTELVGRQAVTRRADVLADAIVQESAATAPTLLPAKRNSWKIVFLVIYCFFIPEFMRYFYIPKQNSCTTNFQ
jgi:hypothetical protein